MRAFRRSQRRSEATMMIDLSVRERVCKGTIYSMSLPGGGGRLAGRGRRSRARTQRTVVGAPYTHREWQSSFRFSIPSRRR